jgi:hypothetical protein
MKIKLHGHTGRNGFELDGYDCNVNVKLHGFEVSPEGWEHYKWKVRISYQGRAASFDYRTGTGHRIDEFDFADFVGCIESDADHADHYSDYADFVADMGYEDDALGRAAWRGCRDCRDKLNRVFSLRRGRFFRFFRKEGE